MRRFKKISVITSLVLCLSILFSGSVFAKEQGYEKIDMSLLYDNIAPSISPNQVMQETPLERHQRLINEGWVLEELRVVDEDTENLYFPKNLSLSSGVVIEDMKAVRTSYKQPIKHKKINNNNLYQRVTDFSNVISVTIGALPYSWVPELLGINLDTFGSFVFKGESNFTEACTLRFYEIKVKIKGWSSYFVCASSERYEYASTVTSTGYRADDSPYSISCDGEANAESPLYEDYSSLCEKARYHALLNQGTYYSEEAPNPTSVDATNYNPL